MKERQIRICMMIILAILVVSVASVGAVPFRVCLNVGEEKIIRNHSRYSVKASCSKVDEREVGDFIFEEFRGSIRITEKRFVGRSNTCADGVADYDVCSDTSIHHVTPACQGINGSTTKVAFARDSRSFPSVLVSLDGVLCVHELKCDCQFSGILKEKRL